ncbi:MAG: magnesium transporter [Pseudomonadota bacterium]
MQFQDQLSEIIHALDDGTIGETRLLLAALSAPELAGLLESMPSRRRRLAWELLHEEHANRVLSHLHEDVRGDFLAAMDTEQLLHAADELEPDDFADILQQLPGELTSELLEAMDAEHRARVEAVLSYPEDSAGGIMNTDAITVRPRHSLELVLRYLRGLGDLPSTTDQLFVVNSREHLVGGLPLSKLVTSDPSVTVRELMDTELEPIPVDTEDADVARLFAENDLVTAPVVDDDGRLIGRITVDDVVDVIIEDADEAVLAGVGLDTEEDMFAPIWRSSQRRAIWLGINLITAFLAAAVINIFEETIAKVVALAVLMPIVASMGGIAGTQTLTLVIRGLALDHIGRANLFWLVNRELVIALLNGLLWATVVALAAALAFQDIMLGGVIALAVVLNMLIAAISGALLPGTLERLGIDPAIAGGVILTTITDVAGFFLFLGLASWAYT